MIANEKDARRCSGPQENSIRLMARGMVFLTEKPGVPVEVWRGMVVACREGGEIGRVAALAVDTGSGEGFCLILGHLPQDRGYQSVPVSWIERVEDGVIRLGIDENIIRSLPDWHPA